MLDDAAQRQLATRMGRIFAAKDIAVVFVGSTAVVGLRLYPRTSKDTDALAAPDVTLETARRAMREIAAEEKLTFQEKGWGTLAVVKHRPDGTIAWEVDLLVPEGEMVPPAAARRIHDLAVGTDIGRTAIPEHLLAMKAVAYGDCTGKDELAKAEKYESDLLEFRKVADEQFAWDETRRLLSHFPEARRRAAAEKIREVLGRDLGFPGDVDRSFG